MNRLLTRTRIEQEYGLPTPLLGELFRHISPACTGDDGQELFLESVIDGWLTQRFAAAAGNDHGEFMTTRDVAKFLACSYSEARERMLDGRIRAIKDGRWLRTRRGWVEEYVAAKAVKTPVLSEQDLSMPAQPRIKVGNFKLKPGGAGIRFLERLSE